MFYQNLLYFDICVCQIYQMNVSLALQKFWNQSTGGVERTVFQEALT